MSRSSRIPTSSAITRGAATGPAAFSMALTRPDLSRKRHASMRLGSPVFFTAAASAKSTGPSVGLHSMRSRVPRARAASPRTHSSTGPEASTRMPSRPRLSSRRTEYARMPVAVTRASWEISAENPETSSRGIPQEGSPKIDSIRYCARHPSRRPNRTAMKIPVMFLLLNSGFPRRARTIAHRKTPPTDNVPTTTRIVKEGGAYTNTAHAKAQGTA